MKTSFKPPVRLGYRALKQVWKQVGWFLAFKGLRF